MQKDLQNALKGLKKTQANDRSAPSIGIIKNEISESDIVSYRESVLQANIESWEKLLGDLTFKTNYVELSIYDAVCLLKENSSYCHRDIVDNSHFEDIVQKLVTEEETLSSKHMKDNVEKIKAKVQKEIEALCQASEGRATGVFVKSSSRSAKDAVIVQEKLRGIYDAYLKRNCSSPPYELNDKVKAIIYAGTQVLKCHTGEESIDMMLKSERIEQDFKLALESYHESSSEWNQHIAIREWINIDPSQEWRCFIKNRKVTAVSQYNYCCRFQDLIDHKEDLQKHIFHFLNDEVLPLLPCEDFKDMVIDVALTPSIPGNKESIYSDPKCYVIELNPYLSSTDGALFSWRNDSDILEGISPREFRVQDLYPSKTSLLNEWRDFIDVDN